MYDNDELSNSNKDYNNLEDDDQNAEEQKKLQQAQKQHWAYKLFIEHPELYLLFLEQGKGKEKAVSEVEGICKIFDEYKMPKDSNFRFILWYRQAFNSFG